VLYWNNLCGIIVNCCCMEKSEHPHGFREQRYDLVDLLRNKGITDEFVLRAIYDIPREFFMPRQLQYKAYEDKAFPIGEGQTISQPYTVAYQTQLLHVEALDKILEIGTGSAYQAVILCAMGAIVYTIERQKKLYDKLSAFLYLKNFRNLFRFYGDGFKGLPDFAPFDKILITAGAPYIPPTLTDQLATGGLMVLPINADGSQQMIRVTKLPDGNLEKEYFDFFSFVPMLKGKSE
jgi:protein-L-isoaspartate(D-aspartate) O-methyltransferase